MSSGVGWNWTKLDESFSNSKVVEQFHEYGCGAACVVMLLADRGIPVDQLLVQHKLHLPSTAAQMAQRLEELSENRHHWIGGHLDFDFPIPLEMISVLGEHGSWSAQLIPENYRDGHWVVVDGVAEDKNLLIRDPVGSSYRLPYDEFAVLLRNMVVVFERGA